MPPPPYPDDVASVVPECAPLSEDEPFSAYADPAGRELVWYDCPVRATRDRLIPLDELLRKNLRDVIAFAARPRRTVFARLPIPGELLWDAPAGFNAVVVIREPVTGTHFRAGVHEGSGPFDPRYAWDNEQSLLVWPETRGLTKWKRRYWGQTATSREAQLKRIERWLTAPQTRPIQPSPFLVPPQPRRSRDRTRGPALPHSLHA
jgi:hypothetical protein